MNAADIVSCDIWLKVWSFFFFFFGGGGWVKFGSVQK